MDMEEQLPGLRQALRGIGPSWCDQATEGTDRRQALKSGRKGRGGSASCFKRLVHEGASNDLRPFRFPVSVDSSLEWA
jgi:hypothetical protein